MKWKTKKKIAYEIAKEFWNQSSYPLRYKMMRDYINFINYTQDFDKPYTLDNSDYIKLSECDWKQIPLYRCNVEPSDIRTSVCYYLGIGLYEGRESGDKQYQREYTLRTLGVNLD